MIWAVVMAGGSGTRFWPLSRSERPKQLLPITGKRTMLEETVARLSPLIPAERILIVTQRSHQRQIRKILKHVPAKNILAEPCPRSTAPCLALAALHIAKRDPSAVFAALPADHLISNAPLFRHHLKVACSQAAKGRHVVFGIPPSVPHTGYGYIACRGKAGVSRGIELYDGLRFVEKPSLRKAKAFLKSGKYFWNSGMFVWEVSFFLRSMQKALPQMSRGLAAIKDSLGTTKEQQVLNRIFPSFPNISIDYGLMEKAAGLCVVKAKFEWSDVGSWQELEKITSSDRDGNAASGKTLILDSRGNVVKSGKRLIALLGVDNLIVVDSEDALLVARKDRAQDIRKLVDELGRRNMRQYL